mgnify:CR=1 FL=1
MKNEKTEHTPGPWRMENNGKPCAMSGAQDCYRVLTDKVRFVAEVPVQDWPDTETMNCQSYGYSYAEAEANAHLIAAAPDLLAACEAITHLATGRNVSEVVTKARAAIAKATGK